MKRILLTLAVGALLGVQPICGQQTEPAEVEPPALPALEVESSSLDLGIVPEGGEAVGVFTLRNTGTADLKILKVKPG